MFSNLVLYSKHDTFLPVKVKEYSYQTMLISLEQIQYNVLCKFD